MRPGKSSFSSDIFHTIDDCKCLRHVVPNYYLLYACMIMLHFDTHNRLPHFE